MKNIFFLLIFSAFLYSCGVTGNRGFNKRQIAAQANDTVRIANDSLEYEIIIIEPGFPLFINSIARQRGYYSQEFLERKNELLVLDYNRRVQNPNRFNPNLYVLEIDYQPDIDYGYEVNYLLYNYFVFFSREYNQKFSVPTRI